MKKIALVLMVFTLAGCAELGTAIEFADIILNDPKPVPLECIEKTVGTSNEKGQICRLYTDGSYRWTK
jgi:hypothetical protein